MLDYCRKYIMSKKYIKVYGNKILNNSYLLNHTDSKSKAKRIKASLSSKMQYILERLATQIKQKGKDVLYFKI
jgi:hypothetical protein